MTNPLTLLYTHNLRGDLNLLPNLHTFIKQLKQLRVEDDEDDVMLCAVQPPVRKSLLMDMGNSCSANQWHCNVTGGRSALIVMDAMGYAAAHVTGQLAPGSRERMGDLVTMALVDIDHVWEQDGILASPTLRGGTGASLQIVMQPGSAPSLTGRVFTPMTLKAGEVGVAHIAFPLNQPQLMAHSVFPLPPNTPPDPTIAGTVEFVLDEARYFQKRQANG